MRRIKAHSMEKLAYINKYVDAYLNATKKWPNKIYVDAFAGTGKCCLCSEDCKSEGNKCNCGKGKEVDGSSLIAMKSSKHFNKYVLVELDKKNCEELNENISKEIEVERKQRAIVYEGDTNKILPDLVNKLPNNAICLIVLDPEGPELHWETVASLSRIRADLFILYPYDMALCRLVPDYKEKLNKFYGSEKWLGIYNAALIKAGRRKLLLDHYTSNLKSIGFVNVTNKLIRANYRTGKPLYHLVLASKHPLATKIMDDIYNKPLDNQLKLL